MAKYKVTTEIKTSLWKRILRTLNIIPGLPTFTLVLNEDFDEFYKGQVIFGGKGKIKIVEKL